MYFLKPSETCRRSSCLCHILLKSISQNFDDVSTTERSSQAITPISNESSSKIHVWTPFPILFDFCTTTINDNAPTPTMTTAKKKQYYLFHGDHRQCPTICDQVRGDLHPSEGIATEKQCKMTWKGKRRRWGWSSCCALWSWCPCNSAS